MKQGFRETKQPTKGKALKELKVSYDRNKRLARKILEAEKAIVMRCRMEGCRYGYTGYHKELKNECIWCGKEKPKLGGKMIDPVALRGLNGKKLVVA